MCSILSWVGSLVDSDCVLWHGLIKVGGGGKISLSKLFNYFSVSGDSKQKKIQQKSGSLTTTGEGGALCGGHHPKLPLFFWRRPLVDCLCETQHCLPFPCPTPNFDVGLRLTTIGHITNQDIVIIRSRVDNPLFTFSLFRLCLSLYALYPCSDSEYL